MDIKREITAHYARKESSEVGQGNEHLHIGGEHATRYFLEKLDLKPDMKVLDIGCGVGGPAIIAAQDYGCHVTGIDLTPEFIDIAEQNAKNANVDHLTNFQIANSEKLDFADGEFDLVMMLHVGMNVPNKLDVYKEAHRVLKPHGTFAIYDILAEDNVRHISYPLPWSPTKETSFLDTYETIENYLEKSNFKIIEHENRRNYAINAIERMLKKIGNTLSDFRKIVIGNLLGGVQQNYCAPHIIIARKN